MGTRLEGLKAVVTGAGGGMGGATALRLAEEGADVAVNDRRPGTTDEVVEAIGALGRDAFTVVSNVTKREGATELVDAALARWGRIDVLVNIVGGIKGPVENPLLSITDEQFEVTWGINLRGTFLCTQLVAPGMMERRFGKIVNIASIGWAGEAMHAHYAAAKAGVVAFTRSTAHQLAAHDINVNAIAPGGTRRVMEIEMPADVEVPASMSLSGMGPLGRMNEPLDIANAALFLVSQESRNISGQLLTVAGGTNPSL